MSNRTRSRWGTGSLSKRLSEDHLGHRTDARALLCLALAIATAFLAGCPGSGFTDPPLNLLDGNTDPTLVSPLGKTSGEPNDAFTNAIAAVFDDSGNARLQGTVSDRGDRDIFLLGSVQAGDRITVDVLTAGSPLDSNVVLYDDQERLIFTNDDRCDQLDQSECLDAFVEFQIRHDSAATFLVITNSSFNNLSRSAGAYTAEVTIERGLPVPAPRRQILVLDFDGARVNSTRLGVGTIAPFDAGNIDSRYEGDTETIIETIRAVMEQNYERFDVEIRLSTEQPPLSNDIFSIMFFGGFDPGAFGLAENVDIYNIDRCDDAIIFIESFTPAVFSRPPSTEELGIAIGNVASHEAGHLLGLNHVDDNLDIMDDVSPADIFITDQEFKESKLSGQILNLGKQDGVLLLLESVGPAP